MQLNSTTGGKRIAAFDSSSELYERAFATFLAHTDQKDKARAWLDGLVIGLPRRTTFVDAGAGNGKVTAWFTDAFDRTIAIEPNPHLRKELARCCPRAEVIPTTILDAPPIEDADFVLLSHVLYYIPEVEWLANLERLADSLAPAGKLVVVLQNTDTDCMRLVERFHGRRFRLRDVANEFEQRHGLRYSVNVETVESHITTSDLPTACGIAEFMLNLLPLSDPPRASEVETFVRNEFASPSGGYRYSCSQDALTISRTRVPQRDVDLR